MAHESFKKWRAELLRSGEIAPLRIGASQEEVMAAFGPPDDTSLQLKHGWPLILKYTDFEFHFDNLSERRLWLIYSESEDGSPGVRIT